MAKSITETQGISPIIAINALPQSNSYTLTTFLTMLNAIRKDSANKEDKNFLTEISLLIENLQSVKSFNLKAFLANVSPELSEKLESHVQQQLLHIAEHKLTEEQQTEEVHIKQTQAIETQKKEPQEKQAQEAQKNEAEKLANSENQAQANETSPSSRHR